MQNAWPGNGWFVHTSGNEGLESPSLDTIMVYSKTITINFMTCMKHWDTIAIPSLCACSVGKKVSRYHLLPTVSHILQ